MTEKKVKKTIKAIKEKSYKLRPDDIWYIMELANEHRRWGVDRIFEEALRPRMRSALILPLTPKIKKALKRAASTYQISMLDVCYHILEEWLKANLRFSS